MKMRFIKFLKHYDMKNIIHELSSKQTIKTNANFVFILNRTELKIQTNNENRKKKLIKFLNDFRNKINDRKSRNQQRRRIV